MYLCCLKAMQNACKHAGERATIRLRLREKAGTLTFVVSDDGAGFDAAGRASVYAVPGTRHFPFALRVTLAPYRQG